MTTLTTSEADTAISAMLDSLHEHTDMPRVLLGLMLSIRQVEACTDADQRETQELIAAYHRRFPI